MSKSIFLDTETTGFPYTKHHISYEKQPHLVQLGALLVDDDTREVVSTLSVIIKPDEWEIPEYATAVHGITNEQAHDVGIPEDMALLMFLYLQEGAKRVAHNWAFDNQIIKIAVARFIEGEALGWERESDSFCTMNAAKSLCPSSALANAYKSLVGEPNFKAHDALADAQACMEIYYKIIDKVLITQ